MVLVRLTSCPSLNTLKYGRYWGWSIDSMLLRIIIFSSGVIDIDVLYCSNSRLISIVLKRKAYHTRMYNHFQINLVLLNLIILVCCYQQISEHVSQATTSMNNHYWSIVSQIVFDRLQRIWTTFHNDRYGLTFWLIAHWLYKRRARVIIKKCTNRTVVEQQKVSMVLVQCCRSVFIDKSSRWQWICWFVGVLRGKKHFLKS